MYTISKVTKEIIDLNKFHLLQRGGKAYYSDLHKKEYLLEDVEELYSHSEIDLFEFKLKVILTVLPTIISATPQNPINDHIKQANNYADEIVKLIYPPKL